MRWIDEQYLVTPFYGSRRMTAELRRASHRINRKRVQRLMRLTGLEALGPKPKTSRPSAQRRHCVANGLDFGADAGNRGRLGAIAGAVLLSRRDGHPHCGGYGHGR
jgi:hypothetical protein